MLVARGRGARGRAAPRAGDRRDPAARLRGRPRRSPRPARPAGRGRAPVRPGRAHRPAERAQPGPLQPGAGVVLPGPRPAARRGARSSRAGSSRSGRTSTRTTSSPGRLYKTGQPEAARAAMAEALRLGTRDARLFYHAGMIERALGNPEAAAAYLRQALATNPHFHPRHAAEARRALEALDGARRPAAALGPSIPMRASRLAGLLAPLALVAPCLASAHPMGNFSISHYAAIHVEPDGVRLRYVLDLAEIPTFQIAPGRGAHRRRRAPRRLGRTCSAPRRRSRTDSPSSSTGGGSRSGARRAELIFPPGAGGLPTLKLGGGVSRRAAARRTRGATAALTYRDGNYPERAGWKEIVATGRAGRDARRQHRARARPEPRAVRLSDRPGRQPAPGARGARRLRARRRRRAPSRGRASRPATPGHRSRPAADAGARRSSRTRASDRPADDPRPAFVCRPRPATPTGGSPRPPPRPRRPASAPPRPRAPRATPSPR